MQKRSSDNRPRTAADDDVGLIKYWKKKKKTGIRNTAIFDCVNNSGRVRLTVERYLSRTRDGRRQNRLPVFPEF